MQWETVNWRVFQSWRLEDAGPEIFWIWVFKAYHFRRVSPCRSNGILADCWDWRRGPPHCSGYSSQCGSNKDIYHAQRSLCCLVHRSEQDCHMGPSPIWWWQLCSPKSAQECAADSGHRWCIRCNLVRWIGGYMGPSSIWWWQLCGPKSAQECAAGSGHRWRICCNLVRWIGGYMGQSWMWWW